MLFARAVVIFSLLFSFSFSLADSLPSKKDGCADPEKIQNLFDAFIFDKDGNTPKVEFFCVKNIGPHENELTWRLGPTPEGRLRERAGIYVEDQDYWRIVLGSNMVSVETVSGAPSKVKDISLDRNGSIRVKMDEYRAVAKVHGIGFNLSGYLDLLHFGINKLVISDDWSFKAVVSLPLFGIPIPANGLIGERVHRTDIKSITVMNKIKIDVE